MTTWCPHCEPPFNEIELAALVDNLERTFTNPNNNVTPSCTFPHYRFTPTTARIVTLELKRRGYDCVCRPYPTRHGSAEEIRGMFREDRGTAAYREERTPHITPGLGRNPRDGIPDTPSDRQGQGVESASNRSSTPSPGGQLPGSVASRVKP